MKHQLMLLGLFLSVSNSLLGAESNLANEVVARVFDTKIYRKQIEPSEWSLKEDQKRSPNQKWEDLAVQHRSKALSYYLWKQLKDGFVKEHNIQVTDRELDEFMASEMARLAEFRKATETSLKQLTAQLRQLTAQLRQSGISQGKREELEEEISELRERLAMRAEDNEAGCRLMCKVFLESSKIDQALYHTYGGRVVKGQVGIEPLAAYQLFFEEHQKKGDFEIFDKAIREEFWRYFTTMERVEVPKDEIDFTTPWWLKRKPDGEEKH